MSLSMELYPGPHPTGWVVEPLTVRGAAALGAALGFIADPAAQERPAG
jgi:hypothetical protein